MLMGSNADGLTLTLFLIYNEFGTNNVKVIM